MHKKFFLVALLFSSLNLFAQDDESAGFFKKENLFTGGTVNASFGNSVTALGISPYFGYSFNKFIDIAFTTGINYQSQRDVSFVGSNDKIRFTSYGPGAFVRLFPLKFLFAQGQYEFNLLRTKYLPFGTPNGVGVEKYKFDAHSFLVGGGISNGKDFPNQKSYYYFSILWDVAKSPNSPYKDNIGRSVPIIRAGYNIALFQGRN